MKQSCVIIILVINFVNCDFGLQDLVFKGIGNYRRNDSLDQKDIDSDALKFALSILGNTKENSEEKKVEIDKDSSTDSNRFFYSGIDWTLNLLPTIILIKLAFIGGFLEFLKYIF